MKRFFKGPALLLAALALLMTALPALALDVPKLTGRVNDYAGMLSEQAKQRLEQELMQFEASDSTQVVVLTIPSLEGESLEDYSIKVAQAWGIGQKGKDNGVLLLISKGDRKMRIEVGYGLEGRLTDALTGRILDNIITPRFRAGNFDAGVEDGVTAIIAAAKGEYKADMERSRKKSGDPGIFIVPIMIGVFIMAILRALPKAIRAAIGAILLPILGFFFSATLVVILLLIPAGIILGLLAPALFRSGGRGFYSGGGGGFSSGGGFSGGGGSFGGGGSSGGW